MSFLGKFFRGESDDDQSEGKEKRTSVNEVNYERMLRELRIKGFNDGAVVQFFDRSNPFDQKTREGSASTTVYYWFIQALPKGENQVLMYDHNISLLRLSTIPYEHPEGTPGAERRKQYNALNQDGVSLNYDLKDFHDEVEKGNWKIANVSGMK
ncbi:MAG: hypothetical protein UT34_C0002G0338 [candidate division WS6 bacterium GW2011_GWF2_39_15]|uniref:Uncharacterized protein n=1 Tax=candidate division WS6 bacterium GW2011_GWF2_39_15 TaxID=1619100 RepID=A0A0G0MZ25_9BACT|nr:MAG: hypothetical protein UT34_C0002G0338 [candidate division WS6 bacterium GW2011_GWF2_39_15]